MNVVNLFKGFEGEPEIQIISKNRKGQIKTVLRLRIG